eukprot:scaffold1228_cov246-Pinguiococcus_pyrenoidosus.AAC.18
MAPVLAAEAAVMRTRTRTQTQTQTHSLIPRCLRVASWRPAAREVGGACPARRSADQPRHSSRRDGSASRSQACPRYVSARSRQQVIREPWARKDRPTSPWRQTARERVSPTAPARPSSRRQHGPSRLAALAAPRTPLALLLAGRACLQGSLEMHPLAALFGSPLLRSVGRHGPR